MHADRHLLFGLLALQNNFVDRRQLLAAFDRWVLDKSQPLGQILLKTGSLRPEEHQLLEALAARHISRHGDNPEQSLAAIGSVDSVRDQLQHLADADIHASLLHVPATRAAADDPYATMAGSSGGGSSGGLRFRILRPHAKGGLGQVSVALDEELRREVALKEIQDQRADDPQSRARFLLEAEITGALEHPGVVPVYSLGVYDDGRPFYAMRFIRGDSLQDAIERFHGRTETAARDLDAGQRLLELRQLLGRFIDVCNTIEYAHSRRVLHRDLKPANVMLGSYGETLVVDWGLAKAQGRAGGESISGEAALQPSTASGSMPTMMGAAIGTPQYMSPEQTEGQLDRLGPATDVYSLGATLYCLLTGTAPFSDPDAGAVLRKVRAGDFPTPRAVKKDVPRGLEAICLKAMARKPPDRYISPRQLADDIEHWLADEAVTALPESLVERLARWTRRHRAWTRAAAAALLLVTIVSIAAGTLIDRSRRSEAAARREADRQRAQAEEGFLAARRAVDDFFTHVSENKLLNVPGLQPLRKELLATALAYYQDFILKRAEDPTVQSELAATYYRVGLIENGIGTKANALSALDKALTIQRQLTDRQPASAMDRFALADTYNAIGGMQLETGDLPRALTAFGQARQLRSELVQSHPKNQQYRRKLANSHNNIAVVQAQLGKQSAALDEYQRANAARAQLHGENPGVAQFGRDLAQGHYNLGLFHLQNERLDAAIDSYRQALRLFESLVEMDAKSIDIRRELVLTQCAIGDAEAKLGRTEQALASYQAARQVIEQLARANPFLLELRAVLGRIYMGLGRVKHSADADTDAVDWLEKARAVQEQLVAEDPTISRYREGLATCLDELALVGRERGQAAEAAALLLERKKLWPGNAAELYHTAAQLALTAAAVGGADAELSAADCEMRQSIVQSAVEALCEAVAAGYQDFEALRQDPDFASLRELPDFRRLVEGETEAAADTGR